MNSDGNELDNRLSTNENINTQTNFNTQISLYPNPNSGAFTLQINIAIEKNTELIITNAIGQVVYKQYVTQGDNNINASKLASGIYHYSLLQNKQHINKGKLIIK